MHDSDDDIPRARIVEVSDSEVRQRIDNFLLSRAPGVPRSHVYRQIRTGQVRVNGGRVKPTRKLALGDKVRIPPTRTRPAQTATVPDKLVALFEQRVLLDHADFMVIDKPAGLAVHAGSGVAFGVIDVLRQHFDNQQLELVHRLDKGTSGCLLVAKNRGRCRELQQLFREQAVGKHYICLLDGAIEDGDPGKIDVPLLKNKAHAGERRVMVDSEGQAAVSHFHIVQRFAEATLVKVRLETGRTHQIRVHAKHLGHPVVGDTRYADNARNTYFKQRGLSRLYLHSSQLSFAWKGAAQKVESPVDLQWQQALTQLTQAS